MRRWGHQRQVLVLVDGRTSDGGQDVVSSPLCHLVLADTVVVREHLGVGVVEVPQVASLVLTIGRVSPDIGDALGETLGIDATLREVIDDGVAFLLADAGVGEPVPDTVQLAPLLHSLLQDIRHELRRHIGGVSDRHKQVLLERGHTIGADETHSTDADARLASAIERVTSDDTQGDCVTLGRLCGASAELVLDVRASTPSGHYGLTLGELHTKSLEATFDSLGEVRVLDAAVAVGSDTDDAAVVPTLVAPRIGGLAVRCVERNRLDRVLVGVETRRNLLAVGASDLRLALVLLTDDGEVSTLDVVRHMFFLGWFRGYLRDCFRPKGLEVRRTGVWTWPQG